MKSLLDYCWIKSPTVPLGAAFDLGVSPTAGSTQENETDEDGRGGARENKRKHTAGDKQR